MKYWAFTLLAFTLFIGSCSQVDQKQVDKDLIEGYISSNNLNAEEIENGLFVVIDQKGSGTTPDINSKVKVHYRGTLLDGTQFDSSYDRGEPATFFLWQVIEGWQIGIPEFKAGGKGKILVPSHLGYGENPQGTIPGNSVLVFDIELLEVL
ncbi:MAG: FKBP-type peptidyl-prolyl cis-trans isomerase [Saprospiraceae bacterium]